MGLLDLLLVAVGLSMDAFAVSVCKGFEDQNAPSKNRAWSQGYILVDSRALMPTLGYICGGTIRPVH